MSGHKHIQGVTLIELILYSGLLIVMLSVLYQLFSFAGIQKIREFVENALYTNGQTVMFEVQNTLKEATVINEPVLGATSNILRLNGGTVVIQENGTGQLTKTQGGVTQPLTDQYVIVDSVVFKQLGPSTAAPTVEIELTLTGRNRVDGKTRTETFRSSMTLR